MSSYLQKRRRRWYAILEIPKALRPHFGRARFVKSLETDSRTLAERRVHVVIGAWKKEIAVARGEGDDGDFASAKAFWHQLRNAETEQQGDLIEHLITSAADEIGYANVEIDEAPSKDPEAQRFYETAHGGHVSFT